MNPREYTLSFEGHPLVATFSSLADQTNGSVMLSYRDTLVLATCVMSSSGAGNPGYFNLQVEYSERHYAAGKILGSRYMRREGRPTTRGVLSSRIIDRTLRPLFEHHIKNAVQVVVTVLSLGEGDPTVLGVNAASLALATSDIPWAGPVGAVQLLQSAPDAPYFINTCRGNNPSYLDLVVCGKGETINMIEADGNEVPESIVAQGFLEAERSIAKLEAWQKTIVADIGKEKQVIDAPLCPDDVKNLFSQTFDKKVRQELFGEGSKERIKALEEKWDALVDELYAGDTDDAHETRKLAAYYFHHKIDDIIHEAALLEGKRADLRDFDTVRPLYSQAGSLSPLLHGSGIFFRGGTHTLSVLTLGGPEDTLIEEGMEEDGNRRFFLHYNFPPYSAGETGRIGSPNRRAIGHGKLAEKALSSVLPPLEDFPYTIRLVAESMASNGSTSQGAICAGSLALMDGGVPIRRHVAGIAMGLMMDPQDPSRYAILTDIQGPEDHHGDMDFKVAGTREGVTAIQLDIKVSGIPRSILVEALEQAKKARFTIIDSMESALPTSRDSISPYAPKIVSLSVPVDFIGRVIGQGGKTIQDIQERTQTTISIEDDGTIFITGLADAPETAKKEIQAITHEWKEGESVEGTVIKVLDEIGAIVSLSPYADGMVHISELASFRVQKVSDIVSVGQKVPVTVLGVDKERDRISLSVKKSSPDFFTNPYTS